jgi:hypothetical protein
MRRFLGGMHLRYFLEAIMLSPHEFATLLLVKEAAGHIAEREDLGPLLELQLVALERLGLTHRVTLTTEGKALLDTLSRPH